MLAPTGCTTEKRCHCEAVRPHPSVASLAPLGQFTFWQSPGTMIVTATQIDGWHSPHPPIDRTTENRCHSERSVAESKNLRIVVLLCSHSVRRSFDYAQDDTPSGCCGRFMNRPYECMRGRILSLEPSHVYKNRPSREGQPVLMALQKGLFQSRR